MPNIEYMSAQSLAALRTELADLVGAKRLAMADRIAEAVQLGDLSENGDYEDAKRQQSFLEGRIQTIEQLIRNAVIVEAKGRKRSRTIEMGSKVTINTEDGKETFTIVGSHEARPSEGRISNQSPVGRAMLGKQAGEEITARTPGGDFVFKILTVS